MTRPPPAGSTIASVKQAPPLPSTRTYLVECFGAGGLPKPTGPSERVDPGFLAILEITDDEQLLVLVRGGDEGAAVQQCVAAGLTVDRVVEVVLSPTWRWAGDRSEPRRRGRPSHR